MATPVKERVDILDVLRGFALLGVLIDNVFGFSGWGMSTDATKQGLATWPADALVGTLEQVFVSGKFYSLFSMLFGIGFSIILIRNEQKGINPLRIFYRRLFILMLIGFVHLRFLWEGDILFLYAVLGFLLPLFRKWSDRSLLITSAALVLSPILIDLVYILVNTKPGSFLESIAMGIDNITGIPPDKESYSTYLYNEGSGWKEWQNWMASGWAYRFSYFIESSRIPKVFAMFLLGFYVGRKMMYLHLEDHKELFRKLRFWGLLIGIPTGIGSFYFQFFQKPVPAPIGVVHTVFYALSVVPMSLAYTSSVCLHWMKTGGNTVFKYLAPVGRMALTNYLMQTIIGIFLYYGVGLGLGGHIGPSIFIPVGIVVYIIQVIYSNWWFKHFQYGPMEWLWRQATYGKRLALRKGIGD